jgi:hypothetical protein
MGTRWDLAAVGMAAVLRWTENAAVVVHGKSVP